MTFIKQIPIPMAGLILAIVSLGNYMIQQRLPILGTTFVWIAILLLVLLTIRVFIDFQSIQNDFKNPMIAAVAPTFTMATFGVAVYLNSFIALQSLASILWYGAIILHLAFIAYFTFHFVFKRDLTIDSLYPSWFITYIGIGVITLTSPSFNLLIGQIFLVLALINYVVLIPLMLYRVFKTTYNEKPALPLLTILTAPTSLCLAGYITIAETPNFVFVLILFIISQAFYLIALYYLPNVWRLSFYPSFSAFTFPLVITAIAATLANSVLNIPYFNVILAIELLIAVAVTLTVFIYYIKFLFNATKKEKAISAKEIHN